MFATYLGGTGMESLNGVTVDPQGNIYVVGETFGGFPNPTPGAIQPQLSGRTDAFIIKISPVEIPDDILLVSSVLPSSRSVQVGTPATAFATMINAGQSTATSCSVVPITNIPATFLYQTTNPATNQIIGTPNTPINVAGGAAQSFVLAFTPTAPFPPTDVQLSFDCTNSNPAPVNSGLNTLLLSASNDSGTRHRGLGGDDNQRRHCEYTWDEWNRSLRGGDGECGSYGNDHGFSGHGCSGIAGQYLSVRDEPSDGRLHLSDRSERGNDNQRERDADLRDFRAGQRQCAV